MGLTRNGKDSRRYGGPRGFSLLEMAAVLALVGLLAAVGWGSLCRSREVAHRAACDVQLKTLALALDAYRQEQGHFPGALHELVADGYIPDKSVLHCPDDPSDTGTYDDFYIIRSPQDDQDLPLLICPYHELDNHGTQAYVGRYTTQFMTRPAVLSAARFTTVQHPAQTPLAAPVGLVLHGADRIVTGRNGAATINFADGSSASLTQNCDLTVLQSFLEGKVQPPLYTLLRQTAGSINYTVNTGSKFDVTTPAATAGALGTKFNVTVAANFDTTLSVTQGKVLFATTHGSLHVRSGNSVTARHP